MADDKTSQPNHSKQSEIDHVVRQYGLTREEARELIRAHGDDRKELDAAAGRLKAGRPS